ncbi:hypothetical protein AKJ39_03425 [candidate division MSBL1 archaeon SCGC-AAA259J03]|uniref:anthranilate synthase n=1 Tax=candidate division MSBL1 archaeon SCGC-AAA259J03 TaxID=1698269 RepID=A0A656YVR6_9EURY|nr:hypothetical protein AKJ39_03425 [candidate division MSBL1 archaeon SCGC-AAA259J03]
MVDPSQIFLEVRKNFDLAYLLESLDGFQAGSRFSVIGCGCLFHLKFDGSRREVEGGNNFVELSRGRLEDMDGGSDPLEAVKEAMFMDEMKVLGLNLPRYILGVTGYLSYDYIRGRVKPEPNTVDDLNHPLLEFALPESVIVFDHQRRRTYHASLMLLTEGDDFDEVHSEAVSRLGELNSLTVSRSEEGGKEICIGSNFEKKDFEESVDMVKDYIQAGDVIQTVLSRRIDLDPSPSLDDFYRNLRRVNPSPYMFFLDFPEQKIVGSSPEALVRVQGREVLTRPIAGTRRRGRDEEDDLAMEEELLNDEKERAEHVMLVDLGRNDIGRVSEFGSVNTPEFMEIEKYGDVQHIVSTVTGKLKEDTDAFDALRAVFPAGTVTGAPKVRAMEIIEELEPTQRGIYSGAVGSISYTGDADFAIAIRTLTSDGERAQVQVGAGIVADSIPREEYYETQNKARSLLRAAGVENESGSDR